MEIIRKCKEHGKMNFNYRFCSYCGIVLEIEEIDKEYEIPKSKKSKDDIKDLAYYEARGTAWGNIGLNEVVAFSLADRNIAPKELQEVVKIYKIKGVGGKSLKTINEFTEDDFEKFDRWFNELTQNNS